jgi:hypothetical protein
MPAAAKKQSASANAALTARLKYGLGGSVAIGFRQFVPSFRSAVTRFSSDLVFKAAIELAGWSHRITPPRCEVVHTLLGISAHLTAMAAVGVSGLNRYNGVIPRSDFAM